MFGIRKERNQYIDPKNTITTSTMRKFYIKVRKCHHNVTEEAKDFKSKKGHFVSTGDALVLPD